MNDAAARFLARAFEHYRLNPRSYHRVVKLARTIADLAVEAVLREEHVTEALSLRRLEISAAATVGNPR
jgi:magnesium chelatase family protein